MYAKTNGRKPYQCVTLNFLNFDRSCSATEKQGLVVIGASIDEGGGDEAKSFAQKSDMNYIVGFVDDKVQQVFAGIEAIPTTFVIDH